MKTKLPNLLMEPLEETGTVRLTDLDSGLWLELPALAPLLPAREFRFYQQLEQAEKGPSDAYNNPVHPLLRPEIQTALRRLASEGLPWLFQVLQEGMADLPKCSVCGRYFLRHRKNQTACAPEHSSVYRARIYRDGHRSAVRPRDRLRKETLRTIQKAAKAMYLENQSPERIREECDRINAQAGSPLGQKAVDLILYRLDEGLFPPRYRQSTTNKED